MQADAFPPGAVVRVSVLYEGNLRCLSVHGPSNAPLMTDAPADNLGRGDAFSPTDLTATSLATCMLTTMAIVAQKKSLPVDLTGSKASVEKHMTSTLPRRIERLVVDLQIPLSANAPERPVLEEAARTCPVALSLHPDVEKSVTFRWSGSAESVSYQIPKIS